MQINLGTSTNFNNYKVCLYLFVYKTIIELVYVHQINPAYGYTGLTIDINFLGFWISTIYLLMLGLIMPKDTSRPSTYLYLIFVLFLVIPLLSYYWLNNKDLSYVSVVVFSCILISIFLKSIKPVAIFEKINNAKTILALLFIIYIITVLYLVVKRGGIDLRALNFMSIYELRSEAQFSGVFGYLLNWCAKVMCPFFFSYYLYKKKKINLILVIMMQLLLYLSFGFKAYLFSVAMLIMVVMVMKRKKFERDFTLGLTGLIVVSYLVDILDITTALRNSITFRMVFVPAQIQYQYYDFFSVREKMFYADGIIGKLFGVESPFDRPVPYVISSYFHNGAVSNSNTGIFSDAYANGGVVNLILMAMVFMIILYLVDSLTGRVPTYIVVASFSYMMFVLNDNSLLTAFLTGGIGLMLVLLMVFNSSIKTSIEQK